MRGEGYSLSDIAAATGNGRNEGFGGFGGDGWAWIIVLFLIFGWGRNGFGGNGTDGSGAAMNYVLNSDFATLQRLNESGFDRLGQAINQVNNGLCTGFYQEAQLVNGLSSQLASCCCDIREGISGVNYNMAMNTNAIQNSLCGSTRDIVDAINNSYRSLHDEITANRIEDKNATIAAQAQQINALQLAASQEKQTNYLYTAITDKLSPCPIPAYITCNPNQSYPVNYVGFNSGCGCGNF